jgi:sulfur carrier protein
MQVLLNGIATEIPDGATIDHILVRLGLSGQHLAIEVNEELVPRGRFSAHLLAPTDKVEIIQAVGGG